MEHATLKAVMRNAHRIVWKRLKKLRIARTKKGAGKVAPVHAMKAYRGGEV
jgi:hypothetical protein